MKSSWINFFIKDLLKKWLAESMLEKTELSDMDREQPRKIKRNGNQGVYGNSNRRIRNGKDEHGGGEKE